MKNSESSVNECKDLSVKPSYKLSEEDLAWLNGRIDLLKDEIQDIIATLMIRSKFTCNEEEKKQEEFWKKCNETQEVSVKDIEEYARIKESLNEALRFSDKMEYVFNDSIDLLEELQKMLRQLL